jgi:hypothetical protein
MGGPPRVVVVRPWADPDAPTSCCGGQVRDAVCLDDDAAHRHRTGTGDAATPAVAQLYQRLRVTMPAADVQIVSSTNAAYLVPWAYRSARRRGVGVRAALMAAVGATRAGAVIVDGAVVGDLETDQPARLAELVRQRCGGTSVANA